MDSVLIPLEISIIIINGKNLTGRKQGLRSFACVFGVGSKKFTTASDPVSNGNPKWNEEAVISLKKDCKSELTLKILDNNKKNGKISLPLNEISRDEKNSLKTLPIVPAKNCPDSSGEITFKCWISKVYSDSLPEKGGIFKSMLSIKNPKSLKNNTRYSIDWSSLRTIDTFSLQSVNKNSLKNTENELTVQKAPSLGSSYLSINDGVSGKSTNSKSSYVSEIPHITSIKPKTIRPDKREKLSIHGINFGSSIEDIIDVRIGGKSIISNVIYHSSTLLFATIEPNTLELTQGIAIIITSRSSGEGTCEATLAVQAKRISINEKDRRRSSRKFTETPVTGLVGDGVIHEEESTGKKTKKSFNPFVNQVDNLNDKIVHLNAKNSELKFENQSLKSSIADMKERYNQLLLKVMSECPELLEI